MCARKAGSAGTDLVGQGVSTRGVPVPAVPRALGAHTWWEDPGPATGPHCTLGAPNRERRAGRGRGPLGGMGGWTEAGAPPTPFLASRHCSSQSLGRRPPPAWPPVFPQLPNAEFSREKNQSSWQCGGHWWPFWALQVSRTSAPDRVHARGSVAIPNRVRCAGRRVVRAEGEVSGQADPGASPGRGGWGAQHTRR